MSRPRTLPGLPQDYTSKFFLNDVVTKLGEPGYRGRVLRCWADEDGLPPLKPGEIVDPLDRPLLRGEVGISGLASGTNSIVPEEILILYQREFSKGDIVKRALTRVDSALVMDVRTEVQLEHCVTKKRIKGWVPWDKVKNSLAAEARDRVICDNWIGTVEEVFEEGQVETSSNQHYRVAETSGLLEPGRFTSEILPKGTSFLSQNAPFSSKPESDRIIQVLPIALYVTWNAINQQIPVTEQDKYPEPKKFWWGPDMMRLTHFDMTRVNPPPISTTVLLKDQATERAYGLEPTRHQYGYVILKALRILESRSRVHLRWQDGSETDDWASELVPYRNIDDYETWPGEHIIWRGDNDERRPAVVQSFNPHQRVADLLFPDTQERQTVPVLELEAGGPGRGAYGVGIGQQVLLCADNGSPAPRVPTLGQVDTAEDNRWWRRELAKLGRLFAADPVPFGFCAPAGDPKRVDWWGEVVRLHLDGTVDVKLPSGEVRRVTLKQIQILHERMDGLMGELGGETVDEEVWMDLMDGMLGENAGQLDWGSVRSGIAAVLSEDPEDAVDTDERPIERNETQASNNDDQRDADEIHTRLVEDGEDGARQMTGIDDDRSLEAGPSTPPRVNGISHSPRDSMEDEEWQQFEMLEQAPADHHYYQELGHRGSKTYLSRIAREHKTLRSSLPENIVVRTYEDRTDLMRCLIIGPEGTPYANAPFVFDIYLDPTTFPYHPPTVFFHSHTNGHGRCNPNLYEDGKVCLSVLGTWSGEKSESWDPKTSSLLQVLVSISGLVLVRSPYHCEPAFAKLEGTKEGRVNSRLYSEKAYVLSRSFIKTALERPPSGLEEEIWHIYLVKGKMQAVLDHAKRLIDKGESDAESNGGSRMEDENAEMWNADAMGSLTKGAILILKRTLTALERSLPVRKGSNTS